MINTPEPRRRRCPRWVWTDEMWWTQKHESRVMMLTALWVQSSWEICDLKTRPEKGWETRAEGQQKNAHTLYIENTFVFNGQSWHGGFSPQSNLTYRWQSFQMNLSKRRKINSYLYSGTERLMDGCVSVSFERSPGGKYLWHSVI